MFIATISRGRTIRQVVFGAFLAPIIYSFFFLIVLGSLGIKMQRIVELALGNTDPNVQPNVMSGSVNCTAMGYEGGVPVSKESLALGNIGYFSLACRSHPDRLFDAISPYGSGMFMFLGIITLIGVTLYFVTSSDSGSFVDDTISAGGLLEGPYPQRAYWAITEGACAFALMYAPGAMKALQAVSIISGFPLTIVICYMCASLHRACKFDMGKIVYVLSLCTHLHGRLASCLSSASGIIVSEYLHGLDTVSGEEDIVKSTRFITGLFDWTEGFRPNMPAGLNLPDVTTRFGSLLISIVAPFFTLHDMNLKLFGQTKAAAITAVVAALFVCWIGCMFGEISSVNASYAGWVMYTCMVIIMTYVRIKAREAYNVYGFFLEDAFACLTMYPFVCSQMSLQAKNVDPVNDVEEDPNAQMYKSPLPVKEVQPILMQQPMMQMQGFPSMICSFGKAYNCSGKD